MKRNKLGLLFGALLAVATVLYSMMLLPPLLQDRQRSQTHAEQAAARNRGSETAMAAMVSQLKAQDERIKTLPLSDAEKNRYRSRIWQAAHNEMMRIEASDFQEPYNLKIPE